MIGTLNHLLGKAYLKSGELDLANKYLTSSIDIL